MAEMFHQNILRLARARIGERVTLDDPGSPYHAQVGEIVDVMEEPDETVVFAWITYESRAHRDAVNEKVMKDPRLAEDMEGKEMPFDVKRMLYGGFEMLVAS